MYDVVVIGGGPAGLFTAICCGDVGRVVVLEKMGRCGRKLLMTGAGKCNLTQTGHIRDFLTCYGDGARFLRHALYSYDNEALLGFFKERGLGFVTRENGKVFPKSMKAEDVLAVLERECDKLGVAIETETSVVAVAKQDDAFEVRTDKGNFVSKRVVVATGGMSYPHTGSTGDGQVWAKELGHKIVPMKPALTPLKVKNYALADLSGQSCENLTFTHWRSGKKVGAYFGDVLFTHSGVSGPGILNPSRHMVSGDVLKLNFIGEDASVDREELMQRFSNGGNTLVKSIVRELTISKRFADNMLVLADIAENEQCAHLRKEQRNALIRLLTEYEMEIKELGGYHVAMATAGGVSTKEINPKTMESRKMNGLYFVGEVTDVDGDTGGYNLQATISMAHVCASAIKDYL